MTNHIRENGQLHYSKAASGEVSHFAVCVHVQWDWIALPASLIVFTAFLLVLSIAANRRKPAPLWKASPLAFIFHSPRGLNSSELASDSDKTTAPVLGDSLDAIAAMNSAAKGIRFKLDDSTPESRMLAVRFEAVPTTTPWYRSFFACFRR